MKILWITTTGQDGVEKSRKSAPHHRERKAGQDKRPKGKETPTNWPPPSLTA